MHTNHPTTLKPPAFCRWGIATVAWWEFRELGLCRRSMMLDAMRLILKTPRFLSASEMLGVSTFEALLRNLLYIFAGLTILRTRSLWA